MLNGNIDTELYFIYGLIVVVILLIILVLIIDRKETKRTRRRVRLTDTLNMKPITDDMLRDNTYKDLEIVDMLNPDLENPEFVDTMEIPQIKLDLDLDDEIYHDSDLEKTQAQIRVEEINKALVDAHIDEKIEEEKDKYAYYEDEQERNAIISYEELSNSYDKLYKENEKNQYLDDDSIPINIKELYELSDKEEIKEEYNRQEEDNNRFKNSPYISPVYGIEKPINDNSSDKDIIDANKFLNTLKELRNNL